MNLIKLEIIRHYDLDINNEMNMKQRNALLKQQEKI